jgi:hypothetical protein
LRVELKNPDLPDDYLTSFGKLRPANMEQNLFKGSIRPYPHKSRLDAREMNSLQTWITDMHQRGRRRG